MKKALLFIILYLIPVFGHSSQCDLEFAEACTNEELVCLVAKAEGLYANAYGMAREKTLRIKGYREYVRQNDIKCRDRKGDVESALELLPKCDGGDISKWHNCVGTEVFKNGSKYYGTYVDGERDGLAKYQYKYDKQILNYYGGIRNDDFYGSGVILPAENQIDFPNEKHNLIIVQGNFRNGLQGPGLEVYRYPELKNGDRGIGAFDKIKVGYFKDDYLNGLGYSTYPAAIYFGLMKNGLENGSGSLLFYDGENQIGDFEGGHFKGGRNTVHVLPNGYVKIGEYKNGKFNGKGKLVSPTGQEWPVTWEDGDLSYLDKFAIYFINLPEHHRFRIQKILKKKSLYSSSIDGLWGPGTRKGILQLSKRLGVTGLKPNVVLQRIYDNDQNETRVNKKVTNRTKPKRNSRDDTFLLGLFAAMIIIGGGDISPALSQRNENGFLLDDYISGFNRICIYSNGLSKSSLTVNAASICPISPSGSYSPSPSKAIGFLKNEFVSGLNRNCVYSDGISTSTITISAVSACPLSN